MLEATFLPNLCLWSKQRGKQLDGNKHWFPSPTAGVLLGFFLQPLYPRELLGLLANHQKNTVCLVTMYGDGRSLDFVALITSQHTYKDRIIVYVSYALIRK